MAESPRTSVPSTIQECVKLALQEHNIKLWLSPFCLLKDTSTTSTTGINNDNNSNSDIVRNDDALEQLVDHWYKHGIVVANATRAVLWQALTDWQNKAFAKPDKVKRQLLQQFHRLHQTTFTLDLHILGGVTDLTNSDDWSDALKASEMAAHVRIVSNPGNDNDDASTTNKKNKVLVLQLDGVPGHVSLSEFVNQMETALGVVQLRLVHRGRALNPTSSATSCSDARHRDLLSPPLATVLLDHAVSANTSSQAESSPSPTTSSPTPSSQRPTTCTDTPTHHRVSLLGIASHHPRQAVHPRYKARQETHALVTAIRTAARKLGGSAVAAKFDVTDQHGRIVAMTLQDRVALLTALGLHRLGRQCLDNSNNTNSDSNTDDRQAREQDKEEQLHKALILLIQADAEWKHQHYNNSSLQANWGDKVDNYGLLQLDIAWVYLQLEQLDSLDDSLERLAVAEATLRKQVHANFVTLAIAQAEMGEFAAVPPLAAVFAKLFLLQGVAYLYDASTNGTVTSRAKGKERLDWAWTLTNSLRAMAPDDLVQELIQVMGGSGGDPTVSTSSFLSLDGRLVFEEPLQYRPSVTRSAVISALRRSRGTVDAAAELLAQEATAERRADEHRELQHRYGLCANEKDSVNLTQLEVLQPMLRRDTVVENNRNSDSKTSREDRGSELLAVGLLRLANNDLETALNVYAELQYEQSNVQARVEALDHRLYQRGLMSQSSLFKKARLDRKILQETLPKRGAINDEALARLLSLGVDRALAKRALGNNDNDVDRALLWLSRDDNSGDPNQESTSVEDTEQEPPKLLLEPSVDETDLSDKSTGLKGDHDGEVAKTINDDDVDEEHAGIESKKDLGGENGEGDVEEEENEVDEELVEAQQLLERELGQILGDRDMETEYLGSSLDEEWRLIQKYRPDN